MSPINVWAGYDVDYAISYDVGVLVEKIRSQSLVVALFGAGFVTRYALVALKSFGVEVSYVCDSDERKQGTNFCGYEVTKLCDLAIKNSDVCIFVCSSALGPMLSTLEALDFKNVFTCIPLFENMNFSDLDFNQGCAKQCKNMQDAAGTAGVDRDIGIYKLELMQFVSNLRSEELKLKIIDIVITEACSLKCKDCSNLMQYYKHPQHCDLKILFESVEKIMKSVDWVSEFRVIGGEPFVNKEMFKVINQLLTYANASTVVVYTNATIVPKGENLTCLKNKRVLVNITNYGVLSKNYNKLLGIFDSEGISYAVKVPKWTDSGKILPCQEKTEKQIKDLFFNCCTNDVLTLLHGKLYHCPFSGHAMNLKAVPCDNGDEIDLSEEIEGGGLRVKIDKFYKKKECLTACWYCNGRDYSTPFIEPAVQTKKPLRIPML